MPESDARALLGSDDDDICVSYVPNAGGDVWFEPERIVPLHRLVRRASVATTAGLSIALAACAPHGDGPKIEETLESQRPALLQYEPAIPDAEPCGPAPTPQLGADEAAPHQETPRPERRVRGKRVLRKPPAAPTGLQTGKR